MKGYFVSLNNPQGIHIQMQKLHEIQMVPILANSPDVLILKCKACKPGSHIVILEKQIKKKRLLPHLGVVVTNVLAPQTCPTFNKINDQKGIDVHILRNGGNF